MFFKKINVLVNKHGQSIQSAGSDFVDRRWSPYQTWNFASHLIWCSMPVNLMSDLITVITIYIYFTTEDAINNMAHADRIKQLTQMGLYMMSLSHHWNIFSFFYLGYKYTKINYNCSKKVCIHSNVVFQKYCFRLYMNYLQWLQFYFTQIYS